MEKELIEMKVNLTPEMHAWFKERSQKTGVSMKSLIFLALETYVEQKVIMPQLPEMLAELRKADQDSPL
jgi:hypothetical protein